MTDIRQTRIAVFIKPAHLRLARDLLEYTQAYVAKAVGTSISSIHRFEREEPTNSGYGTVVKLRAFYEAHGVTFYESEDGLGVWIEKSALPPPKPKKNKKKKQSANPDDTPDS